MGRVALAWTGTALALGALPASAGVVVGQITPDCRTHTGTTLLENRWVRVMTRRGHYGLEVDHCYRPNGETIAFALTAQGDHPFPPPAIALSSRTVAYAVDFAPDPADPFSVRETLVDVEHHPGTGREDWTGADLRSPFRAGFGRRAKVGSLVVRSSGSVAWIACPMRPPAGSFDPTCRRPGHRDEVFRVRAPRGKRETLAVGRGVAPMSLRRVGDRITWVDQGRRRSAPLP
jgi:hypothetical protein